MLAEAGGLEVGVRAIDLVADESRELLQQTAVTTRHPELAVPLGAARPDRGAAGRAGPGAGAQSGGAAPGAPGGAARLRPGRGPPLRDPPPGRIAVGSYLTSPRGVLAIEGSPGRRGDLAGGPGAAGGDVRPAAPAAAHRRAARRLPAPGPARHRPAPAIDPRSSRSWPGGRGRRRHPGVVGVRLTGAVSEAVAAQLYALGFRRFAVDADEVRPLLLGLGRAALAQ